MHWKPENSDLKNIGHNPLELRHLSAFQQVYLTRDYTEAGYDLQTNRKGILRMIDRLEKTFQCTLFTEPDRGPLVPTPFADRLYNDLRFLNAAQESLEEHVKEIRENGRLLRIGSSASVFRTQIFRNLFRELQTFDRIRASYTSVKAEEATKALASGTCDVHVGCWQGNAKRFISLEVGTVEFRILARRGKSEISDKSTKPYVVSLDEMPIDFLSESDEAFAWQPLPESQFLHWLDHPEECPAGTRILGPEAPRDPRHWELEEQSHPFRQTIYINFLRQHPYEFLGALGRGIHNRMNRK